MSPRVDCANYVWRAFDIVIWKHPKRAAAAAVTTTTAKTPNEFLVLPRRRKGGEAFLAHGNALNVKEVVSMRSPSYLAGDVQGIAILCRGRGGACEESSLISDEKATTWI
jgi:hypothetical protein